MAVEDENEGILAMEPLTAGEVAELAKNGDAIDREGLWEETSGEGWESAGRGGGEGLAAGAGAAAAAGMVALKLRWDCCWGIL